MNKSTLPQGVVSTKKGKNVAVRNRFYHKKRNGIRPFYSSALRGRTVKIILFFKSKTNPYLILILMGHHSLAKRNCNNFRIHNLNAEVVYIFSNIYMFKTQIFSYEYEKRISIFLSSNHSFRIKNLNYQNEN